MLIHIVAFGNAKTDAIVYKQETEYTLNNKNNLVKTFRENVLILTPEAAQNSLEIVFAGDENIKQLEASLYSPEGQLIKKIKRKDFQTQSYITAGNFHSDLNVLSYQLKNANLPILLEWEYSIVQNNIFAINPWYPQTNPNTQVNQASIRFKLPDNYTIESKPANMGELNFSVSENESQKNYYWETSNLQCFELEKHAPPLASILPYVKFSSNKFFGKDYQYGSNESWKDFGQFYYTLNADQKNIPEALNLELASLYQSAESQTDWMRIVYKHVQTTKRYLSIQIGIGGYRSDDIAKVYETGYGDCKSLSNFIEGALSKYEIEVYPVLINAGREIQELDESFISSQFNHVILCALHQNDTIWIESTSANSPLGYLGSFTSNRKGLLIKNGNSQIVQTPKLNAQANKLSRKINIELQEDGEAVIAVVEKMYNIHQEYWRSILSTSPEYYQKQYLQKYLAQSFPNSTIMHFNVDSICSESPFIQLSYQLHMANLYSAFREKMFLNTSQFTLNCPDYSVDTTNRLFPVTHDWGYSYDDTILINIPKVMSMPVFNHTVENKFLNYHISTQAVDSSLQIIKSYEIQAINLSDLPSIQSLNEAFEVIRDVESQTIILNP